MISYIYQKATTKEKNNGDTKFAKMGRFTTRHGQGK